SCGLMATEKDLVELVKSIDEPTTLERLMSSKEILQLSPEDKTKAREILKGLLGAAVRLGFIYEYKEYYCEASHADDMIALMGSDSQSDLDDVSSESMEGWGDSGEDES
ncbi:hypothetical protein KR200_009899, partial [Drosophila serrata]